MDTTMVNLKIISKLEPEKKLETDGLLFQHVEWSLFPEGARRWWYGHSRSVTITKIQQLYETAFAKIKGDDDKSRLLASIQESLKGLRNLKTTYASDNTIGSQLDVIIEDIDLIIKQNNEVF